MYIPPWWDELEFQIHPYIGGGYKMPRGGKLSIPQHLWCDVYQVNNIEDTRSQIRTNRTLLYRFGLLFLTVYTQGNCNCKLK